MSPVNPATAASLEMTDRNRIHQLALARAQALRDEAIDDFWRGANAMVVRSSASAYRSAQRLAYALARRKATLPTVKPDVSRLSPPNP